MSDELRRRLAAFHEQRAQRALCAPVGAFAEAAESCAITPMHPAASLQLTEALHTRVSSMRLDGRLRRETFRDPQSALVLVANQLERIGPTVAFRFDWGSSTSGCFFGTISSAFVGEHLRRGTFSATVPSLERGVTLDEVLDDPIDGDFFEVEWW